MRNPALIFILLLAACGGGGGSRPAPEGAIGGTVQILEAAPQRRANLAHAVPLRGATVGRLDADGNATSVFRVVADAERSLTAVVEADYEVDVCLHSLDRGVCGTTLELAVGEVCDVVVTARAGAGEYALQLRWGWAREAGDAELPESYWECADERRADELVAAPVAGQSGQTIARAAGLDCLAESPTLCRFRAPADSGDGRRRLCRLLARCARLRDAGLVRYAEPNYLRQLTAVPNDSLFFEQWALEQIRVQGLWNETVPDESVIIAVVDSGVDAAHPAMAGRLVDGYDFVGDDLDPHDTVKARAHGTMVGSIAAGSTNDEDGIAAVAWGARIMPLRVFNGASSSDIFDIVQAIRYAAGLENSSGLSPARAALVANLSFAGAIFTQSEADACAAARAAGTLPVAAAGNDGTTSSRFPAAYPSVLAVGASTRSGERGGYSSYGPWLSMLAPGGSAEDGLLVGDRLSNGDLVYRETVGTSFAAPHVSGVAALLMHRGSLSPDEVQTLLEDTAREVGPPGFDSQSGWGILDADAATRMLLALDRPALIPGERIEVRLVRASDSAILYRAETSDTRDLAWLFADLPAGRYRLEAGTDRDFDGSIDDAGELYGVWRDEAGGDVIELAQDEVRNDLTLALVVR